MAIYIYSIMDEREFEWESQLRFYWEKEPDELVIRQCTGSFGYGYEYMGLNGRLVITPLTDRIYLTLTQVRSQLVSHRYAASYSESIRFQALNSSDKNIEISESCPVCNIACSIQHKIYFLFVFLLQFIFVTQCNWQILFKSKQELSFFVNLYCFVNHLSHLCLFLSSD